jgi:hypothetical protein
MKNCKRLAFGLGLPAIAFFASGPLASAQTYYDLFQTGSGAYVNITGYGQVNLTGVPIPSSGLGNTDTIIARTATSTGYNTIVYALNMESTSPVTYNGQSADIYITVNNSGGYFTQSQIPQPDSLTASTGTITLGSGDTFSSSATIYADVVFVKHGQSPSNSANILGSQPDSGITLTSSNSTYTTTPPAGYPSNSNFPAGGFYPKPVHTGPHPVVQASCSSGGSPAEKSAAVACRAPINESPN